MVDRAILADKIAAVRDAVARIREVLPPEPDAFLVSLYLDAVHAIR